jgi:hypothetical protein
MLTNALAKGAGRHAIRTGNEVRRVCHDNTRVRAVAVEALTTRAESHPK